jgi:hypothetical protein
MQKPIVFLAALLVLGCGSGDGGSDSVLPGVAPDLLISMDWTGCPGGPFDCPNYTATVDATGHVIFDGRSGVEHLGRMQGRIDAAMLDSLLEAFEMNGFFSVPCCRCDTEMLQADAPVARVTVVSGGVTTEAVHESRLLAITRSSSAWQRGDCDRDHPRPLPLDRLSFISSALWD